MDRHGKREGACDEYGSPQKPENAHYRDKLDARVRREQSSQ